MEELAIYFYNQGCNCSLCILKAAAQYYKIPLLTQVEGMCGGITAGFGIGGICSALVAGIMVFGWFFDEETVKRLRLRLISEFSRRHGAIDCGGLQCLNTDCALLLPSTAALIQSIIDDERSQAL